MPRSSDLLPKYRKHKATGNAVVTLSGRNFYLGPYNTKAKHQNLLFVSGGASAAAFA
jgi:hypothetical protein